MRAVRHSGADPVDPTADPNDHGAPVRALRARARPVSSHAWLRHAVMLLALLAIGVLLTACQRGIGDACETALRCSTSGTRLCDLTQPHGYCTLPGCDVSTCPAEAVCVRFWPRVDLPPNRPQDADRLGTNYCMRRCKHASDCRDDDGYSCLSADEFGATHESKVLGDTTQRFCAVRSHAVDAGAADAGQSLRQP
jgi:hypothetical protein